MEHFSVSQQFACSEGADPHITHGMRALLSAVAAIFLCCPDCFAQTTTPPDWHTFSNRKLLQCGVQGICGTYSRYEIGDELLRRKATDFLIKTYPKTDAATRDFIVEVLSRKHSERVTIFLRSVAYSKPRDAVAYDPVWWPLQYLSEECEPEAMNRLLGKQNYQDFTPVACMFWQDTMRQFGKCRYKPAIPRLIQVARGGYACLDIPRAALDSLDVFFPHACNDIRGYKTASTCFENAYQRSLSRGKHRK
jgi:hypothetical protein